MNKNLKVRILKLRNDGFSYKKIVKELNCSISNVSYHCKNENLNQPQKQINKLNDKLILEIKEYYITHSGSDTANKMKVSLSSVYKYCKGINKNIKRKRNGYVKKILLKKCIHCNCEFETYQKQSKFCSRKCINDYNRNIKVQNWLNGNSDGMCGKTSTAKYIKQYMIKINGEKCMECDWNKINLHTKKIPIELEHVDGNFRNNKLENLKLLCPNCHSLTSTYKALNKGNGRPRSKYYGDM